MAGMPRTIIGWLERTFPDPDAVRPGELHLIFQDQFKNALDAMCSRGVPYPLAMERCCKVWHYRKNVPALLRSGR